MEKVPTRKQWADTYQPYLQEMFETFLETFKECDTYNQRNAMYNEFVRFAYNMSPGYVPNTQENIHTIFPDEDEFWGAVPQDDEYSSSEFEP
jgi:hypothetical protein